MLEWEDNFTSFKNKDPAIIEPEREPFFFFFPRIVQFQEVKEILQ